MLVSMEMVLINVSHQSCSNYFLSKIILSMNSPLDLYFLFTKIAATIDRNKIAFL